jgi:hypothetical protein
MEDDGVSNANEPDKPYGYPLRIPLDLADAVRALAQKHKRSFNSEVEYALQVYVEAERGE